MENDGSIEGNVLVEKCLAQKGDQIATHGQQDGGKGKHNGTSRAPGYGHPKTGDLPQARRLVQVGVIYPELSVTKQE